MRSTRTWEDLMKAFLRASLGAFASVMLMLGCGEGPPVRPDYPGEPLVTLRGQMLLGNHVQVDDSVRLALVWYKYDTDPSKPPEIVTEDIAYEPSFPIDFTFHLYAPPPPEALREWEDGSRSGFATLVAYRDDNHNGKLDPIPAGELPQDTVLGATRSVFDVQEPGYTLLYSEDAAGQNGHFTLESYPGDDALPPAEFVPLDTPITLTLTGEGELAALISMARMAVTPESPNPLQRYGLPATPGIFRVSASFVLNIEETSAGEQLREGTFVRVSDGSRWLTAEEASATLDGQPLTLGGSSAIPGPFPTPGGVSTLIVSAPGYPTATYQIKAPAIPRLTSPASGATIPSGSPLHFAWSPGPFSTFSFETLRAGADGTELWSQLNAVDTRSAPPTAFDITTSPISYTGDASAEVVVNYNRDLSRYGGSAWTQVTYRRQVTFTP